MVDDELKHVYNDLVPIQKHTEDDTRIYYARARSNDEDVVLHVVSDLPNSGLNTALQIQRQINPSQYTTSLVFPISKMTKSNGGGPTILETKRISGMSLDEFLSLNPDKWKPVLLQLCLCLEVLRDCGIMHNDLHSKNILVQDADRRSPNLTFRLSSTDVELSRCNYQVHIIDWDRASAIAHGIRNPSLDSQHLCLQFGQCNTFTPAYDFFKCLYNFRAHTGVWEHVLGALLQSTRDRNRNIVNQMFRTKVFDSFQEELLRDGGATLQDAYSRLYQLHTSRSGADHTKQDEISKILSTLSNLTGREYELGQELKEKALNFGYWTQAKKMYPWDGYACVCERIPRCDTCTKDPNLKYLPTPFDLYETLQRSQPNRGIYAI